jgi:hypothetical protein
VLVLPNGEMRYPYSIRHPKRNSDAPAHLKKFISRFSTFFLFGVSSSVLEKEGPMDLLSIETA